MMDVAARGWIARGAAVAVAMVLAGGGLTPAGVGAAARKTNVSALTSGGQPWAWGFNKYEQLCMDNAVVGSNYKQLTAVQRPSPTGVTAIAAGVNHVVFLAAGAVSVCGQRGADVATTDHTPTTVTFALPVGTTISAVAAGDRFSVARATNGTVWAWGANTYGKLGNGTTTASNTPVQVSGLTGITAIAAGRDHALALKSDGTVWAWGANADGQLGDGSTTDSSVPVQVRTTPLAALTGVTKIGAGGWHSLAVVADPIKIRSWRLNVTGQLGDGTRLSRSYAGPVLGGITDSAVNQVVGGQYHSLALLGDNTVAAWGAGDAGQLGNGRFLDLPLPLVVPNLTGVTALAAGPSASHSMAIAGSSVWTWGDNFYAQLGYTPASGQKSATPGQVAGPVNPFAVAAGGTFSFAAAP